MLPTKCPLCHNRYLSYENDYAVCHKCGKYQKSLNFLQKPLAWANNKSWILRLPIIVWFGYMFWLNINDSKWALDRLGNPFSALDLGIHELGHKIFLPFGEFMTILGGSLFQCIFPILCLVAFIKQKWYFSASLCFCWLGINLYDVATYVADARAREIPLGVGPAIYSLDASNADTVYDNAHDWFQLLSRTGHLKQDLQIANNIRIVAYALFTLGLLLGAILITQMIIGSIQKYKINKALKKA